MKNKIAVIIIVLLCTFGSAVGMNLLYPSIQSDAEINSSKNIESLFRDEIYRTMYVYQYELLHTEGQNDIFDIFYTSNEVSDKNKEYFESSLLKEHTSFVENQNSPKNIDFIGINSKTQKMSSPNTNTPLYKSGLQNDDWKKEYQWWGIYEIDSNGILTVESSSKKNKEIINSNSYLLYSIAEVFMSSINHNYTGENQQETPFLDDSQIKPMKDVKYVFAIPSDLNTDDYIYYQINENTTRYLTFGAFQYSAVLILIVSLIALFIPIRQLKETPVINKLMKMPMDLYIVTNTYIVLYLIGLSGKMIYWRNYSSIFDDSNINLFLITILNVFAWAALFLFVMLNIFCIKYIFHVGVKEYFKKHTILGISLCSINKFLQAFDLSKPLNLKLSFILLVNCFIIFFMIISGPVGLFLAVIYTICLYLYAKYYFKRIQNDYFTLKEATKSIAGGNLDCDVRSYLGIFEPFKNDLNSIQKGFRSAVDEEVKSQRMKTELISNVSHDLKTPLTSIITYIDLMKQNDISEEEKQQYIDTLDRNAVRLKNLIEDLFEVSKATSGNISMNLVEVNIVSLMKQVLFEHEDQINTSKLQIRENYSDEKIMMSMDSQKTYRIFQNLIVNITKYAMPASRVYIEVIDFGEYVELSFKNISSEEIDFDPNEIVERFVRGDKSRNTQGSGLGLAIAKSFTELHGGIFLVRVDGDLFKVSLKFKKN